MLNALVDQQHLKEPLLDKDVESLERSRISMIATVLNWMKQRGLSLVALLLLAYVSVLLTVVTLSSGREQGEGNSNDPLELNCESNASSFRSLP
jgi:hypothetical protein